MNQPSILPDWKDGKYHDYYATTDFFHDLLTKYPNIVNVFSIGKSVLGKELWCIRITNEKIKKEKLSCLIDGCIHGCEWEAGEACLYLSEYLVTNFDRNETITRPAAIKKYGNGMKSIQKAASNAINNAAIR